MAGERLVEPHDVEIISPVDVHGKESFRFRLDAMLILSGYDTSPLDCQLELLKIAPLDEGEEDFPVRVEGDEIGGLAIE